MHSLISSIIQELKLDDNRITNIYNYGSWVYGTNHEKSDRDFLIIMEDTRKKRRKRLVFHKDFDYFHKFELHRLNNCDITIHSSRNFELLLEKNYMLAVECVFYPDEFILRNQIDYKQIYLTKYYNPFRLKQVAFYENQDSLRYIISNDDDENNKLYDTQLNPSIDQFLCQAVQTTTIDEDRILKYLFHGIRYLNIAEQLIRTKCIYDFRQASYILFEMKDIFVKNNRNIDFVVDYIQTKIDHYKTSLIEFKPSNAIDGTFQIHITIRNDYIRTFPTICQINEYNLIDVSRFNGKSSKKLIVSFNHMGRYPDMMEQIQTFTDTQFKGLDIIRVKIKSLALNNDVPENDLDKMLFWDKKSNYFEFYHKVLIKSLRQFHELKIFCRDRHLHLASFGKILNNEGYYFVILRLFNIGREKALIENDYLMKCLTADNFLPLDIESNFIVYDSNINLDNEWNSDTFEQPKTNSTMTNAKQRYRIGFSNRKCIPSIY
ncbi:unnamed protein product [Adineta steineri]|uniref:Polymerase nucleotidyl transferase domain-containing protein n=1 Tax=Adineta steineri TaxID=433720 RepID=A0A815AS59_9BILA|nr:unnamed protein product [Adineta steineri]CAF3739038.1 unnamed protein product [Adineta steineri]